MKGNTRQGFISFFRYFLHLLRFSINLRICQFEILSIWEPVNLRLAWPDRVAWHTQLLKSSQLKLPDDERRAADSAARRTSELYQPDYGLMCVDLCGEFTRVAAGLPRISCRAECSYLSTLTSPHTYTDTYTRTHTHALSRNHSHSKEVCES